MLAGLSETWPSSCRQAEALEAAQAAKRGTLGLGSQRRSAMRVGGTGLLADVALARARVPVPATGAQSQEAGCRAAGAVAEEAAAAVAAVPLVGRGCRCAICISSYSLSTSISYSGFAAAPGRTRSSTGETSAKRNRAAVIARQYESLWAPMKHGFRGEEGPSGSSDRANLAIRAPPGLMTRSWGIKQVFEQGGSRLRTEPVFYSTSAEPHDWHSSGDPA